MVDLLAVLPTYISLVIPSAHYLLVIRVLRILRIFRVLKLVQYVTEARALVQALLASVRKITVFLFTVMTVVVIFGSLLYMIEGEGSGFTSIPRSIYWAIVTLTTAEMSRVARRFMNTQSGPDCSAEGHDNDAKHCKYCGAKL